jgi:hypothetical protein
MKISIIQDDGVVGVDGVFRAVDLTGIDEQVHAVQFDTTTNTGHVEFDSSLVPRKPNMRLGKTKFKQMFERYVQRWKAADAPPVRTLQEVKLDKRQQINSIRDNLEQGGFPYADKIIDSNPVSVQRITVAVQAAQAAVGAGQPFAIDWTCQDNSVLSLDAFGMMGMPVALALYAKELHETARDRKDQIEAAASIEAVEAVEW